MIFGNFGSSLTKPKICVYDFDSVLYACSSIIQENFINVIHKKSGKVKEFKNITEFRGSKKNTIGGWLRDTNLQKGTAFTLDDFDIIKDSRVTMSDGVAIDAMESAIQAIEAKPWCKQLKITVGGKGNYRNRVIFTGVYKANRPPKPLRYQMLRDYLEVTHKDKLVIMDNIEADDVASIMGYWGFDKAMKAKDPNVSPIVLIHIDKDINQVPGWHYNPHDKDLEPVWVMPSEAEKCFLMQMLVGDRVDSIIGLPGATEKIKARFGVSTKGIGDVAAEKILVNTKEMVRNTLWCYKDWYTENPYEHFKTDELVKVDWHLIANEQFQLLRLLEDKSGDIPNLYSFCERRNITIESI